MGNVPKVFISYSWDSEEHKNWVLQLAAALRENGIDASIDETITQKGTTNLNTMMIQELKNSDFIVAVLTENYAKKADNLQGGVGLETTLMSSFIMNNLYRVIPIMRDKNSRNSIPFYLEGVHYIDFCNDFKIQDSLNKLLHRIFKEDIIEMPSIGNKPKLKSIRVKSFDNIPANNTSEINIDRSLIPNLSKITDIDKNRFMKKSYNEIMLYLKSIAELVKKETSSFDYEIDNINNKKNIIKIYLNGSHKYETRIWLSNYFGSGEECIKIMSGRYISDSDNSFNEVIKCEGNKEKNLYLKRTVNLSYSKENLTYKEVAEDIWKNILLYLN
jgi:hypothetical protein